MNAPFLAAASKPARPYPGLRPFEAEEWSIFFGRERMIDDVIDRLASNRLVLIHGASGSGKSSLVRAGVMPKLARQYLRHGAPWLTCALRPSGGPLWNLAVELARLEGTADEVERIGAILALFNRRNATLASVVASLSGMSGKALCILVDQFEELFRFEKETSREEAELFVDLISRAAVENGDEAASGSPDVHVVVTMRSEFLGECARFDGLAETINRTQYLVPRMDDDAILRAVRRPAEMFGGSVPEELADRLIASVRGREDELPLLQHGLMLMWDEAIARATPGQRIVLDGAMVESAGGLAELLSGHADAVMESVASDERRACMVETLFRELTDVNAEGSAIRRPRRFCDLVAVAGGPPEDLRAIIDAFRAPGVSFLTPYAASPIADTTIIDISHEALIRCWRRIASLKDGWLKREFDDGLAWRSLHAEADAFARDNQRVLSAAATQDRSKLFSARGEAWSERYGGGWAAVAGLLDASKQAAERTRTRRRATFASLVALTVFALMALVAAGVALQSQLQTTERLREALAQADIARRSAEDAKHSAEAAKQRADTQNALGRKLLSELTNNGSQCPPAMAGADASLVDQADAAARHGNSGAALMLGYLYYCGLGISQDYVKAYEAWESAAAAGEPIAMKSIGRLYYDGRGVARDYAKAREWYEMAAANGDGNAINNLGLLYANGQGVPQDYAKARVFYERAAASGNSIAMNNIGDLYYRGRGIPQDYIKAREWFEKAAHAGNAAAMSSLGQIYDKGLGVTQDYAKAREWQERNLLALVSYENQAAMMYGLGLMYQKGESGKPKDYGKALEYYQKSAARGNVAAINDIGVFYFNGWGVQQDYVKAREWYEKAAEMGNNVSMNNIGLLYANGQGVPQDYVKAREWYERSAAAGNANAMNNIGYLYDNGRGVRQDYAKAREWYEKAAAAGNNVAVNNIGLLYANGHGVPQDYATAREWYERAAAAGNNISMTNIGLLYANGQGVQQDYAKAREWYEKAAAAGNNVAMNNIGLLYANGQGVQQDYVKAREWYEKAAAAGNNVATNNIGRLYANGQGVPQDYATAREWYEKAASAGNNESMHSIGFLYENGQGVQQDYAKAREWYEKAAAAGNNVAMNNIGLLYAKGGGIQQDYVKAREWWEKAAAAGSVEAMDFVGRLYLDGRGVSQDYAKAREWFEKAAAAGNTSALTSASWAALLSRDFTGALADVERVLALGSGTLATEINRAHALMFLDRIPEAHDIYLSHRDEPLPGNDKKPWRQVILEDFDEFRKAGLSRPLMDEITRAFSQSN